MEHYELKLYTVYINDDPELTTYFTTMSNFAKLFCIYSRPRYQVSVYRTIGPLVLAKFLICIPKVCCYDLID